MATQVIALIVAILCISKTNYALAGAGGFETELIHRDSPLSPTYDPSATDDDRLKAALNRTVSRRNLISESISGSHSQFRSRLMYYHYEFLMKIQVGTPPVTIYPILDTGSDIIWAKCLPCTNCSSTSRHNYNPVKSSSYRIINCNSTTCKTQGTQCASRLNKDAGGSSSVKDSCLFYAAYGDGSITKGNMVSETIGLGSNKLDGITFGCGHDLQGVFPGSGIVGLGTGPNSLIKQMGKSIGGRFSYCLPSAFGDNLSPSKISFGDKAIMSGPEVVTTPIIPMEPYTYYYFNIKGFTGANGKNIKMQESDIEMQESEMEGNIIIDSGTTLTYLPKEVYEEIERSYRKAIQAKPVRDPLDSLKLCYKSKVEIPSIKVHLGGGSELVLSSKNTFIPSGEGVVCLAALPAKSIAIYGNIWQQNMHVGYDIEKKLLSFKHGCNKY
ncbi:aspartic proteinase CDR1-like [Impatiens glandulifera]|uniref:aspartic proteinase CDR1-like n=1 Tax=Impatiens glandulifera TaxID=253017 RepID=UPI001FB17B98|nr:aspartic proteinase CDR1-like [Impatiens glandulifera]